MTTPITPSVESSFPRPRILICDDDPTRLQALARQLTLFPTRSAIETISPRSQFASAVFSEQQQEPRPPRFPILVFFVNIPVGCQDGTIVPSSLYGTWESQGRDQGQGQGQGHRLPDPSAFQLFQVCHIRQDRVVAADTLNALRYVFTMSSEVLEIALCILDTIAKFEYCPPPTRSDIQHSTPGNGSTTSSVYTPASTSTSMSMSMSTSTQAPPPTPPPPPPPPALPAFTPPTCSSTDSASARAFHAFLQHRSITITSPPVLGAPLPPPTPPPTPKICVSCGSDADSLLPHVRYVNQAFQKCFGHSTEWLCGRSLTVLCGVLTSPKEFLKLCARVNHTSTNAATATTLTSIATGTTNRLEQLKPWKMNLEDSSEHGHHNTQKDVFDSSKQGHEELKQDHQQQDHHNHHHHQQQQGHHHQQQQQGHHQHQGQEEKGQEEKGQEGGQDGSRDGRARNEANDYDRLALTLYSAGGAALQCRVAVSVLPNCSGQRGKDAVAILALQCV